MLHYFILTRYILTVQLSHSCWIKRDMITFTIILFLNRMEFHEVLKQKGYRKFKSLNEV